jgi:hypothetical protein
LVVLMAPWPGMGRRFAEAFGPVIGAFLAPALASNGAVAVHMLPAPEGDVARDWDLFVVVNDASTGNEIRHAAVNLRRSGYLQIVFYLALVAGWPGRDPKRVAIVLGVGLTCLGALGSLTTLMFLAKRGVVPMGSTPLAVLAMTYRTLVTAPGMAFAVPGFLWLLLARPLSWPPPALAESRKT